MREATRLTNAGRLRDATALIQRTLRGGSAAADGGAAAPDGVDAPPTRVRSTVVRTERPTAARAPAGARTAEPPTAADAPTVDERPCAATTARARTATGDAASAAPGRSGAPVAPGPAGAPGAPVTPGPSRAAATRSAGRVVTRSLTNPAGTRSYKVYVPNGRTGTAMPLIVMLHGCTQDADDFAAGTRMSALADRHGFVVVYPEQSRQANPSRCWNWFKPEDQQRDRGEPSIIADIARTVMASAHVDRRRVHVAGMSAGAAMAVILGRTHPDLFAAVGVHSGLAHGAASDLPSAFRAMKQGGSAPGAGAGGAPTIVFHGDRDQTVDRSNAEQVLRQAVAHVPRPLLTVHEHVDDGRRAATRYVYRAGDGSSIAEGWSVRGLGHAWSGGDPAGSFVDPAGPDASNHMVRFFTEHPHRK